MTSAGKLFGLLEAVERGRLCQAQRGKPLAQQLIQLTELVESSEHFIRVVLGLAGHSNLEGVGRRVFFVQCRVEDAAVRFRVECVRDEREVVARAHRLRLGERVDGEVEGGKAAERLVDELFERVGGVVLVHVDHQVLVDELDGVLVQARDATAYHQLNQSQEQMVVFAQCLKGFAAHFNELLEQCVCLLTLYVMSGFDFLFKVRDR